MTSIPTRPVDNVVIASKGLQDRNINILAETTVENKGKLILTEIFPSVQKHDIFYYCTTFNSEINDMKSTQLCYYYVSEGLRSKS